MEQVYHTKGRDVKMSLKLVKPETKPAIDAALEAALKVLLSDPAINKGREEKLAQAKRDFPNQPEEKVQEIQNVALLHVLIAGIIERAADISDSLAMLVLESMSKVNMVAMLELIRGPANETEPAPEKVSISASADIPNVLPRNLAKMKES